MRRLKVAEPDRRRLAIALAGIAVLCVAPIAARFILQDGPTSRSVTQDAVAAPTQGLGGSAAESSTPPTTGSMRNTNSVSARLRREFREAPDLYAFALDARRRSAEGGLFYAIAAADACSFNQPNWNAQIDASMLARTAESSTVTAAQIAVVDKFRRRCAGFHDTMGVDLHDDIRREAKNRSDPLLAAAEDLSLAKKKGDPEIMRTALKALIDFGDPLFLSSNSVYLMSVGRGWNEVHGLWFEGRDYSAAERDEWVFRMALELATCSPGEPCATDSRAYIVCGGTGYCASDWADSFFNGPRDASFPRSVEQDEQVRNLMNRMRDAIARGDIDAFGPAK